MQYNLIGYNIEENYLILCETKLRMEVYEF